MTMYLNLRNRRSIMVLAVFALVLVVAAGCGGSKQGSAAYHDISSQHLRSMLEHKDFFMVDVHIPEQKHVAGTDAVIPYTDVKQRIGEFPSDKQAKIVLYCRSGRMSALAAKDLVSLGYSNVWNLEKGTEEWRSLGYPVGQ